MLELAMNWLRERPMELSAQFVFAPLLDKWQGCLAVEKNDLLELAMNWLRAHSTEIIAGFVLHPLLDKWPERLGKEENELLELAMNWLRAHPTELDAQFVLAPLLDKWQGRLGIEKSELLKLSIVWLEQNGSTPVARFVLNGLLLEPALMPDDRRKWSCRALVLAGERQAQGDETHLLKTLLKLVGRYPDDIPANEIIIFAGGWLDRHPTHPERIMVLARLLRIVWLPDDVWIPTAWAALDCLESQAVGKGDDYVLNGLATRLEFLESEKQARWLALSCRWVEQSGSQRDCDSLLINCLKFFGRGVSDDMKAALGAAYSRRFTGMAFNWNHQKFRDS